MPADAVSFRTTFAPHLPFLRRYARAVAGSQKAGDAYVRAALESLLVDPALADAGTAQPRVALFRLFHAFWAPVNGAARTAGDAGGDLVLSGREALLLTAVEGFSLPEAGEILGLEVAEVERRIADVRAHILSAIRSRVLIIEDEPIISMHLEQLVSDMGHDVVATAITRDDAVREAERTQPDLVLADIQLADGSSGIDAVRDILGRVNVPVVFITAYPERLLTGERQEPTYLVTKPFQPETVLATIGQALLARQADFAPQAEQVEQ